MTTINPGFGRLLAGGGGVLLLASLFLPWADNSNGASRNGWELSATSDVLFVIVGVCGIVAAITGGRFGFFRPDVSLNGATDILGLVAAIVLGWLILFDFPSGASRAVGVYLALVGGLAITCGAGDFRVTSLFPRIPTADGPPR
jgi:quinol-cytochrome oxidoreductase complex cytochrome b subunit